MISTNKSAINDEGSSKNVENSVLRDNGDPQANKIWILENSITFLKTQHQEMLLALQYEIDTLKDKNIDLQRRLVLEAGSEVIVSTPLCNDETMEVNFSSTVEELKNKIYVLKEQLKLAQDANILLQKELETRKRHSAALRHNIAKTNAPIIQTAEQVRTFNQEFHPEPPLSSKVKNSSSGVKILLPDHHRSKENANANHSDLAPSVNEFVSRSVEPRPTTQISNQLNPQANSEEFDNEKWSQDQRPASTLENGRLPTRLTPLLPPTSPSSSLNTSKNIASIHPDTPFPDKSRVTTVGSAKLAYRTLMSKDSNSQRFGFASESISRIPSGIMMRSAHGRLELPKSPCHTERMLKREIQTSKSRITLPAIRKTPNASQDSFKRKSIEFLKKNLAPRRDRYPF